MNVLRVTIAILTALTFAGSGAVVAQRAVLRPGIDPTTVPYWHVGGEAWGTPAADATTVYYLERSRKLTALDRRNGTVRWSRPTASRGSDPFGWLVEIAGNNVLAADSTLQAFDRASGTPRWTFAPSDDAGAGSYLGPVVNGVAFTGSPSGRVYAVDTATGAERWRAIVSPGQVLVREPDADADIVVASYVISGLPLTGGVIALDARTGIERWRTAFPRPSNNVLGSHGAGNPVLVDEVVLAATAYGAIFAFDRRTGTVRWSLPQVRAQPGEFALSPDFDLRSLALAGRLLIAGSLTGAVTAYDLDTHQEAWRNADQKLASVGFGIATDDRATYVPYLGSRLVAIDLKTGVERWRAVQPGGGFSFPPLVAGDQLFAASAASGLYALRR